MNLFTRKKRWHFEFVSLFTSRHSLDLYQVASGRTPEVAVLQDTGQLLFWWRGEEYLLGDVVSADRLPSVSDLEEGVEYPMRLPLTIEAEMIPVRKEE